MIFKSFTSGSHGNCFLIDDGETRLLVDAGEKVGRLREKMRPESLADVAGCFVTHEHADHGKGVKDLVKLGVDVYGTAGTFKALGVRGHRANEVRAHGEVVKVGTWSVYVFDTIHDVAEPVGYVFVSSAGDRVLYVTDTKLLRYRFNGITQIIIEANYCEERLLREDREKFARVYANHLSVQRAVSIVERHKPALESVFLMHLSDSNGDAEGFLSAVQAAAGVPVYVCPRDEVMEIGF